MTKPMRSVASVVEVQNAPSFKTVVKNNLIFWMRRFDWESIPQVSDLNLEKENIFKAIQAGLRFKSTYSLAVHLLFMSTDTMLQVGSRRPWLLLIKKGLDLCPPESHFLKSRLFLCQAKQMLFDEKYEELELLLGQLLQEISVEQDVDLLWEVIYLRGLVACRLNNFDYGQEAIDEIAKILKTYTLLRPHLCKGKIAMLGGEIAIAQQDWKNANYCLGNSLHHFKKCQDSYFLAVTLDLYGQYYESQKSYNDALIAWQESFDLVPEGFSIELRSRLQTNIARVYLRLGELEKAQYNLENLNYGMMRMLGCQHIHLEAILLLSEVLRLRGATEQAQLMLESVDSLRDELMRSG